MQQTHKINVMFPCKLTENPLHIMERFLSYIHESEHESTSSVMVTCNGCIYTIGELDCGRCLWARSRTLVLIPGSVT